MKAHKILKSFDSLPQDASEWRVEKAPEQTPSKMAEDVEAQHAPSPDEFASIQPRHRWGINE